MDDSYLEEPSPSFKKAVKWLLILFLIKAKYPARWAAFLALHPVIRAQLHSKLTPKFKDPTISSRRLDKLSNFTSAAILYSASAGNSSLPKDYISLYLAEQYYGTLDPPSSPIVVSPSTSRVFKLQSYDKNSWVRYLYDKKHFVVFPLIYGQILSNYLTPTKYKLNQRYLSSSIKSHILNPIWINFRMGVKFQSVDWLGLLKSYAVHNGVLTAYFLATSISSHLYAAFSNLHSESDVSVYDVVKSTFKKCVAKANAVANFIYGPNIWAMLLLSLTAHQLTKRSALKKLYQTNTKQVIKVYIKAVGFTAAFAAMVLSHADIVSDTVGKYTAGSGASAKLSAEFYDGVNMYLARLIVLSKWRIVKENHPWFSILRVGTWERMESVVMCYLVWQLMDLNDYIRRNKIGVNAKLCQELEKVPIMRAVNYIMS